MSPPSSSKVLGMLWKNAGIGTAIGLAVGLSYRQYVAKADMKKIEEYYEKLEASNK